MQFLTREAGKKMDSTKSNARLSYKYQNVSAQSLYNHIFRKLNEHGILQRKGMGV